MRQVHLFLGICFSITESFKFSVERTVKGPSQPFDSEIRHYSPKKSHTLDPALKVSRASSAPTIQLLEKDVLDNATSRTFFSADSSFIYLTP